MILQQLLSWIQHTSLSTAIRRSDWAVMSLEAVHLLGLALLGGAACVTALAAVRPTGLRGLPLATLARGLKPLFGIGLALMAVSGALIVLGMPFKYYLNTAFRGKDAAAACRRHRHCIVAAIAREHREYRSPARPRSRFRAAVARRRFQRAPHRLPLKFLSGMETEKLLIGRARGARLHFAP